MKFANFFFLLFFKNLNSLIGKWFRPCLFVNFHHSISVTHYSSLIILNTTPVWHYHSIFFILFVGPIPVTWCIFFSQYPNSPNLVKKKKRRNPKQTEPVKKKRKRKKKRRKPRTDRTSERKKEEEEEEKKEEPNSQEKKGKKEEVKSDQKLRLDTVCGSPMCV